MTDDQLSENIVSKLRDTNRDGFSQDYSEEEAAMDIIDGLSFGDDAFPKDVHDTAKLVQSKFGRELPEPFECIEKTFGIGAPE